MSINVSYASLSFTKNNIEWLKPKSITYVKNGQQKKYFCDFYLPESNELIEIKGYWWPGDKLKMKLVLEQNPDLKIRVIEKKELKLLLK